MSASIPNDQPLPSQFRTASVRYVIGILFVIYTFNYLDRQLVNILVEPIKRDLLLSDTEMGLISGLAFAIFYTTLGIPLARWADQPHRDRARLISVSLAAWSAMTAACGLAASFAQLMLARIGVGVGEAGCSPAAHSLITEIVPKERRATALGIYALGIPMGKLFGMAFGGWVALIYGWRAAFLIMGLPGIVLAVIAWITIQDPRRVSAREHQSAVGAVPLRAFFLTNAPLFWYATLACSLVAFVSLGTAAFLGSFLIRVYGLSLGQAGLWLGLSMGIGGAVGSWLGGTTCDRLGRLRPSLYMILPGGAALCGGILLAAAVLVHEIILALAMLCAAAILLSFWYGPVFSAVQGSAQQTARATATAVHLFVSNLLGFGLGPSAIGALSDAFNLGLLSGAPLGEAEGLRWAIAAASICTFPAAALFGMAAHHVDPAARVVTTRQ